MIDENKTKQQLIAELSDVRQRNAELEKALYNLKHMKEDLQRSEKRYRTIFENTGNASILVDNDTIIILANSNFEKLSGYSRQELEGKISWTIFAGQEDLERMKQYHEMRRMGSGSVPESYEFQFINRYGEKRDIFVTLALVSETKESIASLMDITERKQTEEKFATVFKLSPYILSISTISDGRYVEVSDRYYAVSGYTREEIIGHTAFEINIWADPQDRERVLNILRTTGSVINEEIKFRMKSGEIRVMLFSAGTIYISGTPHLLVVNVDITERKAEQETIKRQNEELITTNKELVNSQNELMIAHQLLRQSEEKVSTAFHLAPVILTLSRLSDGCYVEVSDYYLKMMEYSRDEVIGHTSEEINIWDDWHDRDRIVRMMSEGHQVIDEEIIFCSKSGKHIVALFSSQIIKLFDVPHMISVAIDITERKQAKQEKKLLAEQLRQAQKMESVGRLAGGVAHDFNNMLSVIIGNTEMAMDTVDPSEPLHKALQDILHAGMRSADLTRQLLAFARKQTVSPKVLDLNDTVTGMIKMLQRLIGEDINLAWMPGQKLWRVRIDPSQVDQLLANLMVNARDAIDKTGKITIETTNTICDESYCSGRLECIPGEYVILAVSDDGCGMEKETLANIFEPFFTTKKEGQGTGLGLATVYGIVRQNSGFINVYSEPGKGTTFRIHLPRHKGENLEVADDKGEIKAQGGTETVLIVEDEEAVLNLSRKMLERLGYRVMAFRKPDEAIRQAKDHEGNIDLLLTDVVMPVMNGKELSDRISSVKPGLKCLYMSGYTADVIARQGILDEGIQFIPKPFSFKDLAAKIREVLG